MSVDTKGVVVTPNKDVMFVCRMVLGALTRMIQPGWTETRFMKRTEGEQAAYELPKVEVEPRSGSVQFHFTYEGERRTLWLHFHCDCDHQDLGPQSLVLSMGCWGQSEKYMRAALNALSMLGPVYLDVCDSDDKGYELLEQTPQTFLSACAAGLESPSYPALQAWRDLQRAKLLREGSMTEVLGLSERKAKQILEMDWSEARRTLTAMRDELREPAPAT